MRIAIALLALLPSASSLLAQASKPAADGLAAQNALFDEYYENELRNSPESATAYGDYRYNDRLNDYSLAAIARRDETNRAFLKRIEAIPSSGFSDQDQLSHDLLIWVLKQRIADFDLKEHEMPINTQTGIHTHLADLPLAVTLDSAKHYEDYISRLRQISLALSQVTDVLRAGMKDKLMPVRFIAEKIPVQCDGIITADPFLGPTRKYPAGISAEDQKRLTQAITEAVNTDVLPAYKKFAEFVRTEYAPQGRTALAITSLPDGQKRYEYEIYARTSIHMSPNEIHQLGLSEIDRIEAEMLVVARKAGFANLASFRASLKTNPKYIPTSAEQILDDYRHYIAQMQPKLSELFTLLPKSPVTVEAIPEFQATAMTHYMIGTPDGKRPGRVVVATSNFADRSMVEDEAIAYHEGIPGITCSCRFSNSLSDCPGSVCTACSSTPMSKAGRSMRNSWVKRWASTRTRFLTTGVFLPNYSEPCGSSSTREFTPRAGAAIRWWLSSANRARWMSPRSSPRPIAIFPGRPRLSVTNSASSRSANCASGHKRS